MLRGSPASIGVFFKFLGVKRAEREVKITAFFYRGYANFDPPEDKGGRLEQNPLPSWI